MPIINTSNPYISNMKGVHLFHFGLSSCSQRVRFALEEKAVNWQSHSINLNKMEHVSDDYQKIHPKGYVPAFIHNGQLLTESKDIIRYIDTHFDGPSLQDISSEKNNEIDHWLIAANANQSHLKVLTYELLFKPKGHFSDPKEVEHYIKHQKNQELVQFLTDFVNGFGDERINYNLKETHTYLKQLDKALLKQDYLAGNKFSLADIANIVNIHRYTLCQLELDQYLGIQRWYRLIQARPAFKKAITEWENKV